MDAPSVQPNEIALDLIRRVLELQVQLLKIQASIVEALAAPVFIVKPLDGGAPR